MHLDPAPAPTTPNHMDEAEVVNEGWLIKSPPQKRFPRAKWRRRYFLLRRSGSLPSQYVLEYFSDETRRKLKGRIELDQCEQVDAGLTLDSRKHQYDFMFDIRTPKRTFYLVAESKALMEHWVDCICRVCGLKVYPKDGDEEGMRMTAPRGSPLPARPGDPASDAEDSDSPPVSPSSPTSISGPYIPISECISGLPGTASPEPSPTLPLPAPARAPVSAHPFSARRRPLVRRRTDASDLTFEPPRQHAPPSPAAPAPAPSGNSPTPEQPQPPSAPPPEVNWDTYPGQSQHTRSNSMPETVKGGVNKAEQLKHCPPRPPKPAHLQNQDQHNYQNCEELRSPRLSDTESATPRTPTTVPADEMYDPPRSHPERARGRHCYTGASPGQIFNYDFSERPPPAPVVNRTLKPRKTSETACGGGESPAAAAAGGQQQPAAGQPPLTPSGSSTTPASTPGSVPPAVDRALKPSRPSPQAAGKVFPLAPPPVRHGSGVRHQRAAPSPTPGQSSPKATALPGPAPPAAAGSSQQQQQFSPAADREQPYCSNSFHEIQYLDLDLAESNENRSPRTPTKTPLGRESSTGTVYKTVDFVKTEAFNKTRQSVEEERTKSSATLSRSAVDVSRRAGGSCMTLTGSIASGVTEP